MNDRRDRIDYHCARARVGRDRRSCARRSEGYEARSVVKTTRGIWVR